MPRIKKSKDDFDLGLEALLHKKQLQEKITQLQEKIEKGEVFRLMLHREFGIWDEYLTDAFKGKAFKIYIPSHVGPYSSIDSKSTNTLIIARERRLSIQQLYIDENRLPWVLRRREIWLDPYQTKEVGKITGCVDEICTKAAEEEFHQACDDPEVIFMPNKNQRADYSKKQ